MEGASAAAAKAYALCRAARYGGAAYRQCTPVAGAARAWQARAAMWQAA